CHGEDIGRIHTAAEIANHRHIGAQPDLDSTTKGRLELLDKCRSVGIVLLAPVRKIEIPITALVDRRCSAVTAEGDAQVMPRRDRLDVCEHGPARAHGEESEDMIETSRVESWGHGV